VVVPQYQSSRASSQAPPEARSIHYYEFPYMDVSSLLSSSAALFPHPIVPKFSTSRSKAACRSLWLCLAQQGTTHGGFMLLLGGGETAVGFVEPPGVMLWRKRWLVQGHSGEPKASTAAIASSNCFSGSSGIAAAEGGGDAILSGARDLLFPAALPLARSEAIQATRRCSIPKASPLHEEPS